jgi:hypothetical protein
MASYENQGSGFDPFASGYELQGRGIVSRPTTLKGNTLSEKLINGEKTIPVLLKHDVWIETGKDAKGEPIIERITTNTPVLDENGNPRVDPKSKAPITVQEIRDVPISIAKKLIAEGKAERRDPMPE